MTASAAGSRSTENCASAVPGTRTCPRLRTPPFSESMLDLFGTRYDRLKRNRRPHTYRRTSLFDRLPEEFTREMLQETIESMELSTDYTVFISKWNGKGFIEKTGKRSFRKIA